MEGPVTRRLRAYWQLEAANVLFVPGFAIGLVFWAGGTLTPALVIAAVACAALLVVGAVYWRAALRQLEGSRGAMAAWLPWLAAVEAPTLALAVAALIATGAEFALAGGGWTPARIAATSLTALAVLEYVNYYRVQLQHFDNWADFKRLVSGRGFRKAHLARDIHVWRRRRRAVR